MVDDAAPPPSQGEPGLAPAVGCWMDKKARVNQEISAAAERRKVQPRNESSEKRLRLLVVKEDKCVEKAQQERQELVGGGDRKERFERRWAEVFDE